MDFVAIDFETANEYRTSACSLGLVCVKEKQVVYSKSWLIFPEPFYFNPFNIKIHRITADDVRDAPTFAEIWPEIKPLLADQLIVAHNASFDISVLRRTLEYYGLDCPNFRILCTCSLAKSAFPLLTCYRLDIVSALLKIPLLHHDALSDTHACAKIFCKLIEGAGVSSLKELEEYYNIQSGYYRVNGLYQDYTPCRSTYLQRVQRQSKSAKDFLNVDVTHLNEAFADKHFAFTGTLLSMPRKIAREIVARSGGIPQDRVTTKTNYLVVGFQNYMLTPDGISRKMRLAAQHKEKGRDIQIIGEDDFYAMINEQLLIEYVQAEQVAKNVLAPLNLKEGSL